MIYQDLLDKGALAQYAAALNARASRAGGYLSADELRDRILQSGGRCEWCNASLVMAEFELDHILSLKRGGRNVAANLAMSCPDCNRRKGQKHPARFAAEILRETGRKTRLISRLFAHYAIEPAQQMTLFADHRPDVSTAIDADAELNKRPPYNWAN